MYTPNQVRVYPKQPGEADCVAWGQTEPAKSKECYEEIWHRRGEQENSDEQGSNLIEDWKSEILGPFFIRKADQSDD